MNNQKENILVAGANGTTGRIIVNLLQKLKDYTPIAMVRKQEQKDYFDKIDVQTIMADLEEDLNHTVNQIDKVIFAAGSGGANVIKVDQEGAKRLIDAAEQNQVKKFVMLGSIGTDDPSQGGDLKDYLKAKQNADKHLRASTLDYVIVRPGRLTNKEATGKITLAEQVDKNGSISRADVAKTLVEVLQDDVKLHQTFEIIAGDTLIEKAVRLNEISS
ncbi:MAG: SDR family oxidoreductase [Psychroflexus sp.]|nr:SDR family oxidoreductase [Psychroflexus sp.]MDN6310541.1 SDR family oxidoreductase [Psychroflexus sp.]